MVLRNPAQTKVILSNTVSNEYKQDFIKWERLYLLISNLKKTITEFGSLHLFERTILFLRLPKEHGFYKQEYLNTFLC